MTFVDFSTQNNFEKIVKLSPIIYQAALGKSLYHIFKKYEGRKIRIYDKRTFPLKNPANVNPFTKTIYLYESPCKRLFDFKKQYFQHFIQKNKKALPLNLSEQNINDLFIHWKEGENWQEDYYKVNNYLADMLLVELSHLKQKQMGAFSLFRICKDVFGVGFSYSKLYDKKRSFEYEAHREIEPEIQREFTELFFHFFV